MTKSSYIPTSAEIIKRVPKTPDNQYGCITVNSVPVDTPSVVALGGELTTTAQAANSYAKTLQNVLNENKVYGVDVYSVTYHFGSSNPGLERAEQYRIAGRRLVKDENLNPIVQHTRELTLRDMRKNEPVPNYVRQLYNILMRPRITDAAGAPVNVDDAISRVHRIKFYAHCHGASTLWQMANLMYEDMKKLGYTPAETQRIQHEVFVIQHSPIAPLTGQRFTTLSFASAEDTMMQHHNNLFADWIYENSADIVPSFFDGTKGNIFVAGRLKEKSFREHDHSGLAATDEDIWPLTADGKIIFGAERNALVRAAQHATVGAPIPSAEQMVDGNGIDFAQLKKNGEILYKVMLNDLRQQNLKHDYQK